MSLANTWYNDDDDDESSEEISESESEDEYIIPRAPSRHKKKCHRPLPPIEVRKVSDQEEGSDKNQSNTSTESDSTLTDSSIELSTSVSESEDSTSDLHVPILTETNGEDENDPHWQKIRGQWQTHLGKRTTECKDTKDKDTVSGDKSTTTFQTLRLSDSSKAKTRREALRSVARKLGFANSQTATEQVNEAKRDALRRNSAPKAQPRANKKATTESNSSRGTCNMPKKSVLSFKEFVKRNLDQIKSNKPIVNLSPASTKLSKYITTVNSQQTVPQNKYSRHRNDEDTEVTQQISVKDVKEWDCVQEQWTEYIQASNVMRCLADGIIRENGVTGVTADDMARSMWRQLISENTVSSAKQESVVPEEIRASDVLPPATHQWPEGSRGSHVVVPNATPETSDVSEWDEDEIDPVILASIRDRDGPQTGGRTATTRDERDNEFDNDWDSDEELVIGQADRHHANSGCSDRSSPQNNPSPFDRPQSVLPPHNQQWGTYLWADQPDTIISEMDELEHEEQQHDWDLPVPLGHSRSHTRDSAKSTGAAGNRSRGANSTINTPSAPPMEYHLAMERPPLKSNTTKSNLSPLDEEPPPQYDSLFAAMVASNDPPPTYTEATIEDDPNLKPPGIFAITEVTSREMNSQDVISDMMFENRADNDFRLVSRCANKSVQLSYEWALDPEFEKTELINKKEHADKAKTIEEIGLGGLSYDTKRSLFILTLPHCVVCVKPPSKRGGQGKIKRRIEIKSENLYGIDYSASADLYVVTDIHQHCVMIVNPSTKKAESSFGEQGSNPQAGHLDLPYNVKCCEFQGTENIVVSSYKNNSITVFNMKGEVLNVFGEGVLNEPYGLCTVLGKIYVCDYQNKRVVCFSMSGGDRRATLVLPSERLGENHPKAIAIYPDSMACRIAVTTVQVQEADVHVFKLGEDPVKRELRLFNTTLTLLETI